MDTGSLAMCVLDRLVCTPQGRLGELAFRDGFVNHHVTYAYQQHARELAPSGVIVGHSGDAHEAFPEFADALLEAWALLEREGLLIPENRRRRVLISRTGRERHAAYRAETTKTRVRRQSPKPVTREIRGRAEPDAPTAIRERPARETMATMRSPIRVLRFLGKAFVGGLGLLGLIETARGAPETARWLSDLGLADAHSLNVLLAIGVSVICAVLLAGPERIKHWLALAHGRDAQSSNRPLDQETEMGSRGVPTLSRSSSVLPTRRHTAGKLEAELGVTPLEAWLKGRIDEANQHKRERVALGAPAYRTAMWDWDVQNVKDLSDRFPSLVVSYRGDPPDHLPGFEREEAYYERQLAWLKNTLNKLDDGEQVDSPSPRRDNNDLVAAKLREGVRLLAILRANPADFAAAIEPEVEGWWRGVRDDLANVPRAQFELATPWPHEERARSRLEQVLDSGTKCLGRLLDEAPQRAEGPPSPETLRDLLREGIRLRGTLDMWPEPDAKRPAGDDPVFGWTRRTWEALEREEPMTARKFFGDAAPYAGGFLLTAYGIELEKVGRRAYLDRGITILSSATEIKAVQGKRLPAPADREVGSAERTPIPPGHLKLLHRLLDGAIRAVEADQQYAYDEESPVAHTHRDMFAAHFSEAAERLGTWNGALYARDEPIGDLKNRVNREAQQHGFNDPPYWRGSIATLAMDVTLARLHKGVPAQQFPSLIKWTRTRDGLGPTLRANEDRIATAQRDNERALDRAGDEATGFLAEIQSWSEVEAISEAGRRYTLYTDKQPLLTELRKLRKIETVFVSRECEICRGNLGDLGAAAGADDAPYVRPRA